MALDWIAVSVAAGMCAFFIAVLLDMLARTFSLQALSMWVKSEYAQIAVTFLIIGSAAGMEMAGNSIVMTITSEVSAAAGNLPLDNAFVSGAGDPFLVARSYIRDTVIRCEAEWYYRLFIVNIFVEPMSTISLETKGVEAIGGGYVFGWFVSTTHYLANGIEYLGVFQYVQYFILTLAQYTMLPVFLPIGLILRSFPLTRGAGGLVTAFALGFAFVFPTMYVLTIAMMPSLDYSCSNVSIPVFDENENTCFFNAGEVKQKELELRAKAGDLNSHLDSARGKLSLLYLQAFFYPMITLIVTFTFIRQGGSLLGADLAEIGRGLIKII